MSFVSKLLLIFSLPFLLFSNTAISDKCDDFVNKVNDYYDSYVLETYETNNYIFMVVEGVCNDNLSYGVFLACIEAYEYDLKIMVNGVEYTLKEDSRGDYFAYVILKTNDDISVCVYDNVNGNSTKRYEYKLAYESIDELNSSSSCVKGNNLGCDDISKLKKDYQFDNTMIILITILGAISSICVVWILALVIFKKGLFNKDVQKESEVIFFDFNEKYEEDNLENIEVEAEEIKEEGTKEVYEKKYYFEEDTEEFDFKPYLEEKGYKIDYFLMSEEEKNQVMILLMTLKHNGIINEFQYKNEVIKLWKK